MIAVVQRVSSASVTAGNSTLGTIRRGLTILLGVARSDNRSDADFLAKKITGLRIFNDDDQKMNRSLEEVGGELLVISQFTLLGDCRKGRRPSFNGAADAETGNELYEYFVERCRALGFHTETGAFGAMMRVSLVNDGPVTLVIESPQSADSGIKSHPADQT